MTDPAFDTEHARWARARDDYRAGVTAMEVCARYGLGRSAFYARAQAERWRRADLPGASAPPPVEDDFDPTAPRLAAQAMADLAHRRLSHALTLGRLKEALAWSRLAKELRALAEAEENVGWRVLHREARAAAAAASGGEAQPTRGAATLDATLPDVWAANAMPRDATPPEATLPADATDGEGETASPAPTAPQSYAAQGKTPPAPDCPDDFEGAWTGLWGEAEDPAALAPEEAGSWPLDDLGALVAELTVEVAEAHAASGSGELDDATLWARMRARLAQARPDLPWWTGEEVPESGPEPGDEPL